MSEVKRGRERPDKVKKLLVGWVLVCYPSKRQLIVHRDVDLNENEEQNEWRVEEWRAAEWRAAEWRAAEWRAEEWGAE